MFIFSTIFCFLSTFFIIQLAPLFNGLPRVAIYIGLIAAILAVILSLCGVQCIGVNGGQLRERLDDILIHFIFQGLIAIIHEGTNARNVYFYFLPAVIIALFLLRTLPLLTPARRPSKRKLKKRCKRDKKSATVEDPGEEKPPPQPLATVTSPLTISETVLGHGSHDTVVYEGSFQGRIVAVKCFPQVFISLATHEVSILQQLEPDNHSNIIRYYYRESHSELFYIALEFCPASLADIFENLQSEAEYAKREEWKEIARGFDAKRAMKQIASGLRYLHGLELVHRDIKPQNILISSSSLSSKGGYRMLISDFGLCKKLDVDQSSSLPITYGVAAAGTAGWRAPEMLLCGVGKLNTLATGDDTDTVSSESSLTTTINSSSSGTSTEICLTKSVDIFALGCLFYYILTEGRHPYGNPFDREANIIQENKNLSLLYSNREAHDLVSHMLHRHPSQRPDIETCLLHPFFWYPARCLAFLRDASDRFEVMRKVPTRMDRVLIRLESNAKIIVGTDWRQILDRSSGQILLKNLRESRKYDGTSVRDLLRVLRNKRSHYQDLPDDVKVLLGSMPEGFLEYFKYRFPRLLIYVHEVVKDTGLYRESMFTTYFELPEH